MNKKVVLAGCGSANLFAALHLMENGFEPKDIIIIDAGSEPETRTNMLKGFAGAGLKSDGKFVFSMFEDPLSKHISDNEKLEYYSKIKSIMESYLEIPESGISSPSPDEVLNERMCSMDSSWGSDELTLRQSEVWHIGTDNELIMAINMYKYMVGCGVNFMLKHTITDIDFDTKTVSYLTPSRGTGSLTYDYLQIGLGKVGVNFVDTLVKKYNIGIDSGYANVGGRFETRCSDIIQKFADEIQYDFKFLQKYDNGKFEVRSFCTCNYSSYVIEEGIDGVRTYNGHAYGKNHEKENGMTNFGVIARIKGVDAQAFHKAVLSKYGKEGCVIRGGAWDGVSTISKVGREISWQALADMYSDIDGDTGVNLVLHLHDFINRMDKIFGMNGNWSYYIPEIKMAAGVINTNRDYSLADGRYPEVSWVGDSCSGSVGIVPAAVTGMRGVDKLIM